MTRWTCTTACARRSTETSSATCSWLPACMSFCAWSASCSCSTSAATRSASGCSSPLSATSRWLAGLRGARACWWASRVAPCSKFSWTTRSRSSSSSSARPSGAWICRRAGASWPWWMRTPCALSTTSTPRTCFSRSPTRTAWRGTRRWRTCCASAAPACCPSRRATSPSTSRSCRASSLDSTAPRSSACTMWPCRPSTCRNPPRCTDTWTSRTGTWRTAWRASA
mmetsp:Transcript_95488/g.232158  ORF Transcript_95488/g.232158 Transcript_95488/m.232158 type:complete len:225 (-) Transcript_95488:82-756(-)